MNNARRRSSILRLFSLAVVGFCLCQCGGGGDGGGGGPTAPSEAIFAFGGSIANPAGRATIREIEILFDGRSLGKIGDPARSTLVQAWLGNARGGKGRHELALRLVQQTSSPNRYLVGGGVDGVDSNGVKVVDEDFPQRSVTLATGDSVSWSFTF